MTRIGLHASHEHGRYGPDEQGASRDQAARGPARRGRKQGRE